MHQIENCKINWADANCELKEEMDRINRIDMTESKMVVGHLVNMLILSDENKVKEGTNEHC